jgi:amyloid beta precursor protein binding protein 1
MLEKASNMAPDNKTPNFWLIAKSVNAFYEKRKVLPLPGSLPDMKAKSADYVRLQNIYKTKARKDVAEATATVRTLEKELGRTAAVPDAEIEAFCKNASHVKVLQGTPLADILRLSSSSSDGTSGKPFSRVLDMLQKCEDDVDSLLPVWLALQLSRPDHSNPLPQSQAEAPVSSSPDDLTALLSHPLISPHLSEIARAAGGELHNVSSITGGMIAQEAIKVITRQYVPVDNTCVFDGVRAKAWVGKI